MNNWQLPVCLIYEKNKAIENNWSFENKAHRQGKEIYKELCGYLTEIVKILFGNVNWKV